MLHWLSSSNSKIQKSSVPTVSWGLPAGKTCPWAGACKTYCYGKKRRFKFKNVVWRREQNLKLALSRKFVKEMSKDLAQLPDGHYVRIHDTGDFFNARYLRDWLKLMANFPKINFYAYTKAVKLVKQLASGVPNFRPIYSLGGLQDGDVNICSDRHSRIFPTEPEILAAGYVNGAWDDAVAATTQSLNVGLLQKK